MKPQKLKLDLRPHYCEKNPRVVSRNIASMSDHKIAMWNAFVDSQLSGVNDDDCSIVPRVLPASYLPVIKKTAYEITTFVLRLLSLPPKEIEAIVPRGPIRDFLIEEIEVLRFRPDRLIGSFRFDMAIVGEPSSKNPPKLLEINEIGFDGLARSSFIQNVFLSLAPQLRNKLMALDTANAEVRNMKRLGNSLARFQYDCYNWDEEYQVKNAQKKGLDLRLVCPKQFKCAVDHEDFPMLLDERVSFNQRKQMRIGRDFNPDAYQMSFALSIDDYSQSAKFFRDLVRARTPHYGPFITGLVASKMILVLLSDPYLRRQLLGSSQKLISSLLPAVSLEHCHEQLPVNWRECVLKHTDGFGGEQVFMHDELLRQLRKIKPRNYHEWIVQERAHLNTLEVNGILSRPRRVISDLGVFVQYDWSRGTFQNFEVGGFITRATNRSYKVNVSGGGIQVPVMFLRNK